MVDCPWLFGDQLNAFLSFSCPPGPDRPRGWIFRDHVENPIQGTVPNYHFRPDTSYPCSYFVGQRRPGTPLRPPQCRPRTHCSVHDPGGADPGGADAGKSVQGGCDALS
jgi:hypothetical protein